MAPRRPLRAAADRSLPGMPKISARIERERFEPRIRVLHELNRTGEVRARWRARNRDPRRVDALERIDVADLNLSGLHASDYRNRAVLRQRRRGTVGERA